MTFISLGEAVQGEGEGEEVRTRQSPASAPPICTQCLHLQPAHQLPLWSLHLLGITTPVTPGQTFSSPASDAHSEDMTFPSFPLSSPFLPTLVGMRKTDLLYLGDPCWLPNNPLPFLPHVCSGGSALQDVCKKGCLLVLFASQHTGVSLVETPTGNTNHTLSPSHRRVWPLHSGSPGHWEQTSPRSHLCASPTTVSVPRD